MRDSNYLGADSLNWREPPPEHPPVKPVVSTVTPHQEYADFLHKGRLIEGSVNYGLVPISLAVPHTCY